MLRRNMLTADCQNSGVKGKRLGLHSTVFSENGDENTRLNNKNQSKKAEKRWQLRKFGQDPAPRIAEVAQASAFITSSAVRTRAKRGKVFSNAKRCSSPSWAEQASSATMNANP